MRTRARSSGTSSWRRASLSLCTYCWCAVLLRTHAQSRLSHSLRSLLSRPVPVSAPSYNPARVRGRRPQFLLPIIASFIQIAREEQERKARTRR